MNYPQTWLRLRRVGNSFTGFASLDGQTWTQLGTAALAVPTQLSVGLALSSGSATAVSSAQFRDYGSTLSTATAPYVQDGEPIGPTSRRTGLVFSEIMYHPKADPERTNSLEYVELYNADSLFQDLGGWKLAGGINYTFPPDVRLPAGAVLVVAANPEALRLTYGITNVWGPFDKSLGNAGQQLTLTDASGAVKLDLHYGTHYPWPVAADGSGHSLVLRRPSYGENEARAWGASEIIGGSPGQLESPLANPQRGVVINEFLAHTDLPQLDYVELFNHNDSPVDLSGCFLSDRSDTNGFRIPSGTIIPARGFLVFDETQLGFQLNAVGETIYFLNPTSSRVLDTVHFDAQQNGVASGRSPDGSDTIRRLNQPTPGTANAPWRIEDLVINELMYAPISGDSADEFIELFNRGTDPIDLSGSKLLDAVDYKFPTGTRVAAGGYLVIAKDAAHLLTNYPQLNVGNTVGNYSGTLKDSGEHLALALSLPHATTNSAGLRVTNQIEVVVSEVTYGSGGRWGKYAAGGGSSLELTDSRADVLRSSSWADSDESQKSQPATFTVTGKLDFGVSDYPPNRLHIALLGGEGEALVDEIEVFKGTTDAPGANLESNGGFEIGSGTVATGWAFNGNHSTSAADSLNPISGNRSLHLRGQGDGDTGVNTVRTALATGIKQNDTATIRAKVRWLAGAREVLFKLRGAWLEMPVRLPLPTNLGTPGLANSRAVLNAGPAIFDVTHTPVLPRANEPVVVICRVSDPDGIGLVTLRYRTDPSATLSSTEMRDDGTGGDFLAGDGIYSATLNGQASGQLIAFRIQATDAASSPAATQFPTTAPAQECHVRWDDPIPAGNIAHYHLWSTRATENARDNPLNNTYRDTTLVYGNFRVIYNAGFRDKGSPYHGGGGSFAVTNPEEEPLLGVADRIFRATGNGGQESTGLRNQVCSWIGQQLGIPYLHSHYLQLWRNGAQFYNLTQDEEVPTRSYASGFYPSPDEADFYKIAVWFEFQDDNRNFLGTSATLESFKTTGSSYKLARYRWNWQTRGYGGTANNYTNVFNLVAAANNTSTTYASDLLNLADIDQWMRIFAYHRVLGNWDSYSFSVGQNMYAYKVPGSTWKLFPWDIDFTLGDGNGPSDGLAGGQDPVINRMYDSPPFRRMLWRAYQDAVAGPLLPERYTPVIEARRTLLAKNGVGGLSAPTAIYTYLTQRRAFLVTQLKANDATAFTLTTSGGNNFTSPTPSTTLVGKAPFAVAGLAVNGVAYPVTWTDQNSYSIRVPLVAASNPITLTGLDRTGHPLQNVARTITVTYSGVIPQVQEFVAINEIQYQDIAPNASFIELFNRSATVPFDLSGFRLDGVGFTFPPGAIIAPGGFQVIAQDRAGFSLSYGGNTPVLGEFTGSLNHKGEYLRLVKPGGIGGTNDLTVSDVRFDDQLPWPANAAGLGSSLQLIDSSQSSYRVGNWATLDPATSTRITPGKPNAVRESLPPFPSLWLNEVLPENVTGPVDNTGVPHPFLELYNSGTETLDLSPYYLTTSYTNLTQWAFPAGSTLAPGQFLLVWADGQPAQSVPTSLHTNFRLSPTNGAVALARLQGSGNGPAVVDFINYHQVPADRSLGSVPDGEPRDRRLFHRVTAGTANDAAYLGVNLVINEFMAANTSTITNPIGGTFSDWFELYNVSAEPVDLTDFTLTDSLTNPNQFRIPAGYVVPAHGFQLIWADKNSSSNSPLIADLHVNFKLSKAGKQLGVFSPDGRLLDGLAFGAQTNNVSQGRFPDGAADSLVSFATPTPGASNGLLGGNHPPILAGIPLQTVTEGNELTFRAVAADPDVGQTLTYHLSNELPLGATFDLNTGLFSWTPTESQGPGNYAFTLVVTDDGTPPRAASQRVTIVVREQNEAPRLAQPASFAVSAGEPVTFQATAEDSDLPPQLLTFSLLPNAPLGAVIEPTTGHFTWTTPEVPVITTFVISVQVSDNGPSQRKDTRPFAVQVSPKFSTVINEIMYHPTATNAAFIELINPSAVVIQDLSGFRLIGSDLHYQIPDGTHLGPGQFLIVAQDRGAFGSAYGANIPVLGEWTGNLDRLTTQIGLYGPGTGLNDPGVALTRVNFDTVPPWPVEADGHGSSLQLIDAHQANFRVGNWAASSGLKWQHVVQTGNATSSTLYFYLENAGEVYLDDVKLVVGSDPDVGPNLLSNGDFESAFPGPFVVSPNHANSGLSQLIKRSGKAAFHLVASSAGTTRASSVYQDLTPALNQGAAYTLSFWYLPNPAGGTLTLRLSGSGIKRTVGLAIDPAMAERFTPGRTNTVTAMIPEFPLIYLNEVVPNNTTGLADSTGIRGPWMELFNAGDQPVALDGWTLSDSYQALAKWVFPNGKVVGAHQYLVLFADGAIGDNTPTEFHTSFRLNANTGSILLSRPQRGDRTVVDFMDYFDMLPNSALASLPDGQLFQRTLTSRPTPGAPNEPGASALPRLTARLNADQSVELSWPSMPGIQYRIQMSDPLITTWQTLVDVSGEGSTTSVKALVSDHSQRFYRLVLP